MRTAVECKDTLGRTAVFLLLKTGEIMIGIYQITNLINNKVYIGQTGDVNYRWIHHRSDLRSGVHHNKHLQGAWNLYGEENFKFEILEECQIDSLDKKEIEWIATYKSNNPKYGYNLDSGGKGIRGYKHTPEEIDKMRRIQKSNVILQFDQEFNLINRWIGGSSQIRKDFGATKESIDYRCNHKIGTMSSYKGFYWVYEEEYEDSNFTWNKYLNNEIIKEVYVPSKRPFKEPICQYSFSKELIQEYNTPYELENAGYSSHIIGSLLSRKAHIKTYKNSIWCYKSYDFSDGYYDAFIVFGRNNDSHHKSVVQINADTSEIIKEYYSISDAMKDQHVGYYTLISAINSNHQMKLNGSYWQFKQ